MFFLPIVRDVKQHSIFIPYSLNIQHAFKYIISNHYTDVIMTTIASQITSLTVVYSTVYSDADQGKHQSSASLAFVWGIHRDRWIPRTKCQLRGKCFHLMTSSCLCHFLNFCFRAIVILWYLDTLKPRQNGCHFEVDIPKVIFSWWRHQMETFSALLAICAGNSPVTGEFPAQKPVTRSFDVFFDLHLIKRLSKQSGVWWFEAPSRSLWRHLMFYAIILY